ncbi:MAG: integrase/recombinase XerD [Hyphomicrobiales bacterium]|jgi:integrase|nr:integrase/recombinase XerD [Hyphomicrobiales bacterium]
MRINGDQPGSLYTRTGRRKYVTPDERSRFLAASLECPRADQRTLCLTLAHMGCRISEALALTVSCIEREGGFIAFRTLKKRRGMIVIREVPAPAELLEALSTVHPMENLHPDARLWTLSRSRAWQLVKDMMKAARIGPGIHATPKGLRHGFGIHAIRSGVPLNLVQRWLGHNNMATTAIYLQAMGDDERAIASRMW